MMSLLGRVILFASSYAPLLFLFGILESFGDGWPSYACLTIALVSSGALVAMWLISTRVPAVETHQFKGARNRDADVMSYVVSYVVPFAAAAGATDYATKSALAAFALLMAVLYVRSAVFYVHPLLLLAGIHVYDAERGDELPTLILTRRRHLRQNETFQVVPLGTSVFVERPK